MDGDGGGADAGWVGVAFIFFFQLVFLFGHDAASVTEFFDAVGGELCLDDRSVAGFFAGFGVVIGIHHVEILAASEDNGFFVRGNGGPHWFFAHGFGVIEARDFGGGEVVFENEDAESLREAPEIGQN